MDVKDKLRRQKIGGVFRKTFVIIFLTIMSIIVLIPFYWMVASSFKSQQELNTTPPTLYPHQFTVKNYERAFYGRKYSKLQQLNNTLYNIDKDISTLKANHSNYTFDDTTHDNKVKELENIKKSFIGKDDELYTENYIDLDKEYTRLDAQYKTLESSLTVAQEEKKLLLREKKDNEKKLSNETKGTPTYTAIENKITQLSNDINSKQAQIDKIKTDMNTINNRYSTIANNIDSLKNKVKDLKESLKIITDKAKIADINKEISDLETQIQKDETTLSTTPIDLSTIKSEIKEIKKDATRYFKDPNAINVYKYILVYNEYSSYLHDKENIKDQIATQQTEEETPFVKYLGYTVLVGVASTVLGTFLSIIGAFALSRLNFRGRDTIFGIMLATMMIPGEMMVITNYVTITKFKWFYQNELFQGATFLAMIVPFVVTVFHIYLLRQNFKQIPNELYYAAKVDGTSDWKYLWKVMVPLAKSSIITIVILKLMGTWNAYIWPQLVGGDKYQLITVWLRETFVDDQRVNVGAQMAGTVLVLFPLLLVFIFMRKYIMRGVSRGGTKG